MAEFLEAPGSVLIYYNYWTGWSDETHSIRQCLSRWPPELEPAPGDCFWIREDPLHPQGKVYGYQLHRIVRVDEEGVYYRTGFCSRQQFLHGARFISPESRARLLDFLATNPSAREI